jgi:peptide/nickel transport system permease protein
MKRTAPPGGLRGNAGAAALLIAVLAFAVLFPLVAPHDPADLAQLDLGMALRPPAFATDGAMPFLLGTDDQGRDLAASIAAGLRLSLAVAAGAIAVGLLVGVPAGLIAGYYGGIADALLMRLADLQLTYPAVLTAIVLDGVSRAVLGRETHAALALPVVLVAIGLSFWVHIARTVRSLVVVERSKEYVAAARLGGIPEYRILLRHILPATAAPIAALAVVDCAAAVATEATLGFLGLGLPPALPSLGTLIRSGAAYLFSGAWWLVVFPAAALVSVVLGLNGISDRVFTVPALEEASGEGRPR